MQPPQLVHAREPYALLFLEIESALFLGKTWVYRNAMTGYVPFLLGLLALPFGLGAPAAFGPLLGVLPGVGLLPDTFPDWLFVFIST